MDPIGIPIGIGIGMCFGLAAGLNARNESKKKDFLKRLEKILNNGDFVILTKSEEKVETEVFIKILEDNEI
jgi:hypothetical protein